jgi:hypothetical protein
MLRNVILQAFEKIKRIQLQRYHSTEDPEKKASVETNPLKIFHAALINSKPVLQLTPIRRGGVTYQVGFFLTAVKYSEYCNDRSETGYCSNCLVALPVQMLKRIQNISTQSSERRLLSLSFNFNRYFSKCIIQRCISQYLKK